MRIPLLVALAMEHLPWQWNICLTVMKACREETHKHKRVAGSTRCGNVGVWGERSRRRFLETSSVQEGGLIKAQRQDPWTERAALGLGRVTDAILASWEGLRASTSLRGILEARFPGPGGDIAPVRKRSFITV